MRKLILILMLVVFTGEIHSAVKISGNLTTGFFGGTPFLNRENYQLGTFNPDSASSRINSDFFRLYNRAVFTIGTGDFSFKINASRSDLISDDTNISAIDDHISHTKLFQAYGQYDLNDGNVKVGRFLPFNRWFFGSVDGGFVKYNFLNDFTFTGYGGLDVDYGLIYDDEDRNTVGYGELFYQNSDLGFNSKIKVLQSDTSMKAGFDLYKSFGNYKLSSNFGYDVTNSRLFDASFSMYGYFTPKFTVSANVTRFTPISWTYQFYSEYIDRILLSTSYKFSDKLQLAFKQMVTMSEENLNYLSYMYIKYSYFYAGINYLAGDRDINRFGVSLGGNYAPTKDLSLRAGIASVDYMFTDRFKDNEQSYSSYFRIRYNLLDNLALSGNINYYHNNKALSQQLRGGITFQYRFKEGGS